MYKIDDSMTVVLIATYISITILLFLNLFIALFNSTVERIEGSVEKHLLYQRATACLAIDHFTKKCPTLKCLTGSFYDLVIDEKLKVANRSIDSRKHQIERKNE